MDATVAAIWEKQRPAMRERVDLLERVAAGEDSPELTEQAQVAAHQLAGSVGTFGFSHASELARRAQELLQAAGRAPELAAVVAELRADLDLPAFVATTTSEPHTVALVTDDARLAEGTRIAAGQRGLRLATVRPGDTVHATIVLRDGELVAGATPAELVEQIMGRLEALAPSGPVISVGDHGLDAEVVTAHEIRERTDPPGLIVLDDLELCAELRARWAAVPIVAVTVAAQAAFAAGADDAATDDLAVRVSGRLARAAAQRALTDTDPLTEVANRRASSAMLSAFLRMAERRGEPLCLIVIRVEPAEVRRVATALRAGVRSEDVVAHWGAGELVVGMYGLAREAGVSRAKDLVVAAAPERYRAAVAQFPVDGVDLERVHDAAVEALADGAIGGASRESASQQVDVVIVEDEEAIAELMARTLTATGHRCWRFSNGAGAIEMLIGDTPQLRAKVMLLDLQMPAVDGIELLTLLGREGLLRTTNVIVVSSRLDAEEQVRGLGAIDFVPKPIDLAHLTERVELALGRGA